MIVALLNRGSFGSPTKAYSPKTKYVYHGHNAKNNGFGGWTRYLDIGSGHPEDPPEECNDETKHVPVYGWIYHFSDIFH